MGPVVTASETASDTVCERTSVIFISLRRHYPVRFVRSTAISRPLSAFAVRSRVVCVGSPHASAVRRWCAGSRKDGSWRAAAHASTGLLGVLDGLAKLLEELVVMVARQEVPERDDEGDRPVDEFQGGEGGDTAVIGQLLGSGDLGLADQRKVDHEGLAFADFLDGLALRCCLARLLFRHH